MILNSPAAEQAIPPATHSGSIGRTLGPLNPSGVVLIEGQRVPARSESGWVDADTQVEVVKEEAFGVVVRLRKTQDE